MIFAQILTIYFFYYGELYRNFNGKQIISSPDYIIESKGNGFYALSIPEAFLEDTGRYTVVAENEAGKSVSSGIITILSKFFFMFLKLYFRS